MTILLVTLLVVVVVVVAAVLSGRMRHPEQTATHAGEDASGGQGRPAGPGAEDPVFPHHPPGPPRS